MTRGLSSPPCPISVCTLRAACFFRVVARTVNNPSRTLPAPLHLLCFKNPAHIDIRRVVDHDPHPSVNPNSPSNAASARPSSFARLYTLALCGKNREATARLLCLSEFNPYFDFHTWGGTLTTERSYTWQIPCKRPRPYPKVKACTGPSFGRAWTSSMTTQRRVRTRLAMKSARARLSMRDRWIVPTFFVVVGISNTSTRGVPPTSSTKAKAP